jgi:hypothetical protein
MVMNIQVEPWPYHRSCRGDVYRVKTMPEFHAIIKWMWENDVGYLHEFTGPQGYGFSVRTEGPGYLMFKLKWS